MRSNLPISPFNFRWRLAIAFLLVASVAAGFVALGAYALVHNDRFDSFQERAESTSRLAAAIIGNAFFNNDAADPHQLVRRLETQGSFETLIITDQGSASSSRSFDRDDIQAFDRGTDEAADSWLDTAVDENRGLLTHLEDATPTVDTYLFFSSEGLRTQMGDLASSLFRAWLFVTLVSGALGFVLARRTLRPVARASDAARSLAEGLLETRLPVDREDEFGAWAVSFNEMADELQKKIEALTEARDREIRFTADVAHELKTPLTALVGSADLLRPHVEQLDIEARWAAQHLLTEVVRLRGMVEELLEISRLDAGQEPVVVDRIKLDSFLSALLRRRGWQDDVSFKGDACSLETDSRRLERVLSNLVENALVHGRPPVTIEAVERKGRVDLSVIDEGGGVAVPDPSKVFDRFFKADPSRSGGTGLGLAIAKENARLLGGTLAVSASRNGRTIFTVSLPR